MVIGVVMGERFHNIRLGRLHRAVARYDKGKPSDCLDRRAREGSPPFGAIAAENGQSPPLTQWAAPG